MIKLNKLKNEINRIKNVVLSISSGGKSKPKIMPPISRFQRPAEDQFQNKAIIDPSGNIKTMYSFEYLKQQNEADNQYSNPYSYTEGDSKDENVPLKQQSLTNLKGLNAYKKSGILKIKGSQQHSNLDTSLLSQNDQSLVNSTLNLSYVEDMNETDDQYSSK